ncbi:MAG: T9SS type A sorting domain-containing protein, partial [Candidatus Eisenbacteria bacterium]|nr:T9SS type A sorting domain-containing protein [Candidatus Eisenbacteria bacterium]
STPAAGDRSLVVTDTRAMALRTSGNAVFSICDVTGVGDVFEPRAILTPMFPNPMRTSGSTLRYQVERTGPVSIEVYNATGRLQRTLVDQVMPQGSFEIYWDGRNRKGVLVPNGVYYALVKQTGVRESSRVTVLR